MPPASDQSGVVGDIFLSNESKARLLNEPLIDSGRHEQEETDGTPECQFIVGHRARNDHRIGEKRPTTGAKDAVPFPQHGEPIRKVIHRIDAEERIEGAFFERQFGVGICNAEPHLLSVARLSRHL
jgi:hypothetical protein